MGWFSSSQEVLGLEALRRCWLAEPAQAVERGSLPEGLDGA